MAASCHHSELVSPNVPHIDNSEYELVNKQLSVTGAGESRNHQQAISKSRTAALDSAVTILCESVNAITAKRGLKPVGIAELQLTNTRVTDQRTTAYDNNDGVRIYRSTQILSIEMEPLFKELYDNLGANADYGWYMFLRDIDYQLDLKNKKQ